MTIGYLEAILDATGLVIEACGVLVIVVGVLLSTFRFLRRCLRDPEGAYSRYRLELGRAILLGLEFMVAGDIIRTVVVDPAVKSVLVLAIIVLIRTFLSFVMQMEVDRRWPWQDPAEEAAPLEPVTETPRV